MLAKLIKYNLKHTYKSPLIFIIALFISVLLFNITAYEVGYAFNDDGSVYTILPSELHQFAHGFSNFMIMCSLILLFASAVKSIWHYFKSSFYGDQSYLTHTLPIPRHTLWTAQVCNVLIIFSIIIVAIILNCLLLTLTNSGMQLLESFGLIGGCSHCVGEYYFVEPLNIDLYLGYALTIFSEFVFLTLCGLTGIILSNRFDKKFSLLFGTSIYLFGGAILIAVIMIISNFIPTILSTISDNPTMLTPGQYVDYGAITRTMLYIGIIYSSYSVALYFINRRLLNRGINVK